MTEHEIKQAQQFSELWAELVEKGTWFERICGSTDDTYFQKTNDKPSLGDNLDNWRVANKPMKKIDMSCIVDGDILCEFALHPDEIGPYYKPTESPVYVISPLIGIDNDNIRQYMSNCGSWFVCRVMQDHWHSWQGGKCPLPEGLKIDVMLRENYIIKNCINYNDESFIASWSRDGGDDNIIAFKVIGPVYGYTYKLKEPK